MLIEGEKGGGVSVSFFEAAPLSIAIFLTLILPAHYASKKTAGHDQVMP